MKTCVYKRLDLYGNTLGHLNSTGPIYLHDLQKIMGQMVLRTRLGFADHLSLIMCFIFHEEWVHRGKYLNNTRLPYLVQILLHRKIMGRTTSANAAIASFVLQLRSPPVLAHIDSAPRNPLKIQVENADPVLLEI
jgi:hypothetical protein